MPFIQTYLNNDEFTALKVIAAKRGVFLKDLLAQLVQREIEQDRLIEEAKFAQKLQNHERKQNA